MNVTNGTVPIEGAIVTLTNNSTSKEYACSGTGSAGGCTISNVPIGTYTVTATATNYQTLTKENVAVNEESGILNIVLTAV